MKKENKSRKLLSLFLNILGLMLVLWIPYIGIVKHISQEKELNKLVQDSHSPVSELKHLDDYLENRDENQLNVFDPFLNNRSEEGNYSGAVGVIVIPEIELRLPIYVGASDDNLSKGGAFVNGTDLPLKGPGTHSVLAGHRGWYGSNYFLNINRLKPGDVIYLSYLGETGYYVVTDSELIRPWEMDRLLEKKDAECLTLLTCHPILSNEQRLLVNSRLLNEEEVNALVGKNSPSILTERLPKNLKNQTDNSSEETRQDQLVKKNQFVKKETKLSNAFYQMSLYEYWFYWIILGCGMSVLIYDFVKIFRMIVAYTIFK
ncbi:class C sortase [uncultured Vagococcus sp.]|uniref:class C sortase n=1 Tax=uncultured Vagococcus sp. TaxID=189676 RepID=UPI0028D08C6B|nr:class C sortase [uncultured Vagococcus sp.]